MTRLLAQILAPILALVLTLAAHPAAAADLSLDRSLIAGDATWLFHLDLTAIRDGRIGKALDECDIEAELNAQQREQLSRARPVLEKLLSITVYGKADPQNAVLLLRTSGSADELLAAMQCDIAPGEIVESAVEADGYTLRSWSHEDETIFGFVQPAPDENGPRLVYLSSARDDLVAALDTARGKRPSLAAADTPLAAAAPRPGTFIFGAAADFEALRPAGRRGSAPMILDSARALRFEAGEHNDQVFAALTLTTDSPDSARQIADIARGLHAMGQLTAGQNPDYARFRSMLQAVAIDTDGAGATLAVAIDTNSVIDAIRSDRRPKPKPADTKDEPAPEPAAR